MDAFINLIEKLGYPIFVSLWFMLRFDRKVDKLLESQIKILDLIEDQKGR